MKRTWSAAILVLAACSSGGSKEPPPASMRQDAALVQPTYDLRDPEILSIPPAYTLTGKTNTYHLRYYTEHHPGDEHEIPIVTISGSERVATVEEFWEAMKLRQDLIMNEGTREGRILRAHYHADEIRNDDTLDDRISNKRGAIEDLQADLNRLSRQIEAERAVPGVESDKKISFWLKEMAVKENEYRLKRSELAVLQYKQWLREEMLKQSVRGPEVTPKVEPRVRGAESHTFEAPPPPPPPVEKKPEEKPAPEEKKPEEKKPDDKPAPEEKKPDENPK